MSNATIDSSGLLAEKLSLAREVASLKPEIDDLRSQVQANQGLLVEKLSFCLLYTSPSPRDRTRSRMPSSA